MKKQLQVWSLFFFVLAVPWRAETQSFPTDDPIIHRMWEVGVENSQTDVLAQFLMDVIGPRITGSPNLAAAQKWLLETYSSWAGTRGFCTSISSLRESRP